MLVGTVAALLLDRRYPADRASIPQYQSLTGREMYGEMHPIAEPRTTEDLCGSIRPLILDELPCGLGVVRPPELAILEVPDDVLHDCRTAMGLDMTCGRLDENEGARAPAIAEVLEAMQSNLLTQL